MCGIAGFVRGNSQPADRDVIEKMTATLNRRGPDGSGVHLDGPCALGHRRLAIIDLEAGAQPLSNEDGSVWVTYNGELYNELDLRPRLEAQGHHYRTACDTETLVHLYEEHGLDFAADLNGMFALGLWDAPRGRLVLARDRMGQKPLYYTRTPDGGLVFGSEPKALLPHPDVPRSLDPDSLARYLFYEYLPAPYSIWKGLRKLPPAHLLVWEAGSVTVRRYWEPPLPNISAEKVGFASSVESFWSALRDSVGRHRRSDVPLGVFLSGGVDSSSVAAALCELEPARGVHTFSIGFEDPSFDESPYARSVARHLGTTHHERMFSAQTVLELLPDLTTWLDEPFGDASVLPTHLLSRFARESVTVVLGGDGADELLAGYPTFGIDRASRLFGRLPRPARQIVGAAVHRLPVNHGNFSLDFKLKQFLRGAGEPSALAHQRWLGSFSGAELIDLLQEPPTVDVEAEHLALSAGLAPATDSLTHSLLLYQQTYLPEDILFKVDRASMACGLEVRAPMLDTGLVDLMESMPPSWKLGAGQSKRILKEAARSRLPREILERPKKGFGIPVARWLRGPLGPLLDELLAPDRLRQQGLFRPEAVTRRISEHRAGVRDHRKPLWTLLVFQLWHDRWLTST